MSALDSPPSDFIVRLRSLPGVDPVRALRFALKTLLRRYGLRCVSVKQARKRPRR